MCHEAILESGDELEVHQTDIFRKGGLSGCKKVKKDVISHLASSYVRVGSGSVKR